MRDSWVETPIGDVAQVLSGFAFKSELFNKSEGIPLIRIRDLPKRDSTEALYSGSYEDRYVVKKGDFLIGMDGAFHCYEWNGPDALLNQRVCRIQDFKIGRVVPRYIYFAVNQYLDKIEQDTGYTTVKHISAKQVLGITIPLPPLPEQKRIVDLISSVDSYIEALQQQLERAKRSRNAVLHEFMNGEGTAFEQTQLGQIAKFLNGKAYSKEELLTVGKYRVLRVGNFFSNNNWYWSDLELEPNKYCENGDLLYAWSASFGPRLWNEEKVIYHYHIWKVNPDESQVDKKWLFYWLEDDVERIKSASGSGSIMMHVTKSEIEKRAIRLPTLSEQNRQLIILESFDQNIHTLESLIGSTNQLRSSMLSDLLSGEHEIPTSYDKVIGAA